MSITELMQETSDVNVMKSWSPILEKYFSKLDEDDYCALYDEIYETIHGEVLSNDKAMKLVENMRPYGMRWNIDEANKVVGGNFAPATKFYVLNMMYNDYHDMFEEDTSTYIELTNKWLNDVDSDGGDIKTYRYATKV